jgi:hypothetical protein
MNLTHILRALFTALKPRPQSYTTIVYPFRGQAVLIRDDLNIRYERPWYQVGESLRAAFYGPDHDLSDSVAAEHWTAIDSSTSIGDFDSAMLTGADIVATDYALINPASGLSMLDSCTDVMGSPMGMDLYSDCWSDFSNSLFEF